MWLIWQHNNITFFLIMLPLSVFCYEQIRGEVLLQQTTLPHQRFSSAVHHLKLAIQHRDSGEIPGGGDRLGHPLAQSGCLFLPRDRLTSAPLVYHVLPWTL